MLAQGRPKKEVLDFLTSKGFVLHGSRRKLEIIDPRLSKEKVTSLTPLSEYATFMAVRPNKGINTGNEKSFITSSRKFNEGFVHVLPRDNGQYVFERKTVGGKEYLTEIRTKSPLRPLLTIPVKRSDLQRPVVWKPSLAVKHSFQVAGLGIKRRLGRSRKG
jgi:hypothetical protein